MFRGVSCFIQKENAHLEIYKKGAQSYVNYHEIGRGNSTTGRALRERSKGEIEKAGLRARRGSGTESGRGSGLRRARERD